MSTYSSIYHLGYPDNVSMKNSVKVCAFSISKNTEIRATIVHLQVFYVFFLFDVHVTRLIIQGTRRSFILEMNLFSARF